MSSTTGQSIAAPSIWRKLQSLPAARPAAWLFFILWTSAIFLVSSLPGRSLPPLPEGIIPWDKVIHATEWVVWSALASLALALQFPGLSTRGCFIIAAAAGGFLGLVDEFHQQYVPGRSCDPIDWLADGIGAWIGALILLWAVERFAGRPRPKSAKIPKRGAGRP